LSFFEELKRRNVFRVGVAYGIAGWVLLQVADLVLEAIEAPVWVLKALLLVVALGFVAALVISWAYEITADGIKKEADVDRSQSVTPETGRKLDRIIISFLAVAVILLLADRFIRSPELGSEPFSSETLEQVSSDEDEKRGLTPVEEPVVKTPEKSIAVLPFTNMSDDASNEFFADGISEEILNALAKVKELKVAGRTSAFAFKGRNEDLREIGEALGVNHILEGSVRKAGNTVRVTAQLIQVSDGFHLWSETFDRELTDIFAIQDEIANAILAAMKAELIGGQSIASTQVDPAVYEKYLLAKQRSYTRNPVDLKLAASLLEEATEADPAFAPTWAQRGIVTLLMADDSYGDIPHEEAQQIARPYLDKALEVDPQSAEALAGLGLWYRNEPGGMASEETAIGYLKRALDINSSLIDASNWLQLAFANTGRNAESLRILEDMFNRDPLYKPGTGNLIWTYAGLGRFQTARRMIDQIRPYIRDDSYISRFEGNIMLMEARFGEAYPKLLYSYELEPDDANASFSLMWAMQELGMNEELLAFDSTSPFLRLNSMIRLGRKEEGLQFAQKWADKSGNPAWMIEYYHKTRQPNQLVKFIESRWPDLADLEKQLTFLGGFGHIDMVRTAHAYKLTGDLNKFRQALDFARVVHDRQLADGHNTALIYFAESRYWAIAGDLDKSMDNLELALDKNGLFPLSDLAIFPEFDPLLGEARFTELSMRAHEQFNTQRVLAGLEPIDPEQGP
jgi:TolB-like protein